ncbi:MAG: hypothetical protein Q8O25_12495 [Sulfurisoma sp.]|nr:hypothetical protein [Sulfurisoma sp.]
MSADGRATAISDAPEEVRPEEVQSPSGDSARAETEVPLSPAALLEFLRDSERLFRLNPHLEIEAWQPAPGGFRFAAKNESNGRRIETAVIVEAASPKDSLVLSYADGLKRSTTLAVEPAGTGARLVVTEHYPRIEDPRDPRVADVDRSLVPWVAALRRHLIARARWNWLPGWQWWNERFLLGMPPPHRRIVRLIVWVSALEFVVFLGAIVILRLSS